MKIRAIFVTVVALGMSMLYGTANADLVTVTGLECSPTQSGSGCTDNVLFNDLPLAFSNDPGNPIYGNFNGQNDTIVIFTSNELLTTPASGQARIEDNDDDGFNLLTIAMNDPLLAMGILQFNLDLAGQGNTTYVDGVTIDLTDTLGGLWSSTWDVGSAGVNRFSSYGTNGMLISLATIRINDNALLNDVQQIRIDTASIRQVPEPGTLGLLGLGLAGLGFSRRFKKS